MNTLALAAACAAAAPTQASDTKNFCPPPPPELPRKCPRALLPVTQLSVWFVPPPSDRSNCINKRQKGPGCQAASIPCEIFIKLQLRDDKSAHCSTLWTALGHVPPSHEQSHFSGGRLCPSGVLSSMATEPTNREKEKKKTISTRAPPQRDYWIRKTSKFIFSDAKKYLFVFCDAIIIIIFLWDHQSVGFSHQTWLR